MEKKRGKWGEENMKGALQNVLSGKMTIRQAAVSFSVPKGSLGDRKHIKDLDNRMMPLTKKEFLKLAFDLAETLRIPHRFNKEKKRAGKDFYYNFLKRHPNLSLRTAESTSSQRAVGFNRSQVSRFFDKLGDLQNQFHFPASRIFNADETGISCVHINDTKVLSVKAHETGWITADSLMKWFVEFVKRVHPTREDPVLLILDVHSSHKELNVILYETAMCTCCLPPHTTHRLQPLDRTVMKPFKNAYNEACAEWMRRNSFSKITVYEVPELVNVAFSRICRVDLVKKGFQCTGIHPFNPNIFTDLDYLPSQGLDFPDMLFEYRIVKQIFPEAAQRRLNEKEPSCQKRDTHIKPLQGSAGGEAGFEEE
ncbi:hypothetical protein ANN_14000 [Periplaneta americana]|uniref:DDE-1 domain-containing protein n=1 Tax=Periplaneta americana TaxID=6978 RepID=A0ABQ8SWG5_PERAM|nr:hypothetical protein ANN_14000 [Periplaneta americana]